MSDLYLEISKYSGFVVVLLARTIPWLSLNRCRPFRVRPFANHRDSPSACAGAEQTNNIISSLTFNDWRMNFIQLEVCRQQEIGRLPLSPMMDSLLIDFQNSESPSVFKMDVVFIQPRFSSRHLESNPNLNLNNINWLNFKLNLQFQVRNKVWTSISTWTCQCWVCCQRLGGHNYYH